MVKLALLGAGRIGQVHARTIRGMDTATVTAVSDFFPETAQALADMLGAEVRDNDAIMASDDVDAARAKPSSAKSRWICLLIVFAS